MNDPAMNFHDNPLYEKLYHRFSYGGKTVGDMMRSRAREAAANTGREKAELNEITAESCITRANFLPREARELPLPSYRTSAVAALPRRLSPAAMLAVLLVAFVMSFLLVSGIRNASYTEGLLDAGQEGETLYVSELDTDLPL